jgi:FOG: WD40 repeat
MYAVTASWDDTVRVWALRRGAQAGLLTGHRGRVTMLEISPDDRCIAVGTEDGVLAAWDMASRKRIGSLDVDAPITCAAVSEDSRTLVAGDTTGGVHFLRIVHATGA